MMKYLVCSDLHGSIQATQKVYELFCKEQPEKVVLCGDVFGGWGTTEQMSFVFQKMAGKIWAVKGNNDSIYDTALCPFSFVQDLEFFDFGRKLFFTHGHRHNLSRMPELNKGDVFVFGHTHCGRLLEKNGIYIVNVGSIEYPRFSPKSYVVIDEKGITLKDLQGNVLQTINF